MTIYEYLLKQPDNLDYQIIFRFPRECDECRCLFYEVDAEYSIFGNVGKLRNNDLFCQYDGVFDRDIEIEDICCLHLGHEIWILVDEELINPKPKNVFNGDLCMDCKWGG